MNTYTTYVRSFIHACNACRAVPISLFADYTDTVCSRLFKQPIPIMRPIIKGRLFADVLSEIFLITLKITTYPSNFLYF